MQNGGLRTRGITKTGTPDHPLITVVTVVYNGAATLEQTIQSVVNQTYDNVEYIIVDGASTDGTLDIVRKYEDKIDYWQSEPDKGIYDAMNKGLDFAGGDFLIFMGADDIFYENSVLVQVVAEIKNSARERIYYGDVILSSNKERYDGFFSSVKMAHKNICHQAIFYPKKVYKKKYYDTSYKYFADYVYNIKLFKQMKYINVIVSKYNDSGISSQSIDKKFRRNIYFLVPIYLGFPAFLSFWKKKFNRYIFHKIMY